MSRRVLGYLMFGEAVADSSAGGDVSATPTDDTVVNIGRFGLFFHFACVPSDFDLCATGNASAAHGSVASGTAALSVFSSWQQ